MKQTFKISIRQNEHINCPFSVGFVGSDVFGIGDAGEFIIQVELPNDATIICNFEEPMFLLLLKWFYIHTNSTYSNVENNKIKRKMENWNTENLAELI